MKIISAVDAKNRFGQLLEAAQREPVTVTKQGRPAAVLLSVDDYARICGAARDRLMATLRQMQSEAASAGLTESALESILDEPDSEAEPGY